MILEETQALLKGRPKNLSLEAVAKGSGVTYSWLTKFNIGAIENPGIMTLQKLYNFLKDQNHEIEDSRPKRTNPKRRS